MVHLRNWWKHVIEHQIVREEVVMVFVGAVLRCEIEDVAPSVVPRVDLGVAELG
jgi:hypothetical protein